MAKSAAATTKTKREDAKAPQRELALAFRRVFRTLNRMRGRDTHLAGSELSNAQYELLIELDERVVVWRVRHFKVVQRTIGGDVIGTQGTPVEVMGRLIHQSFYPELWDVRNDLTRMNPPE